MALFSICVTLVSPSVQCDDGGLHAPQYQVPSCPASTLTWVPSTASRPQFEQGWMKRPAASNAGYDRAQLPSAVYSFQQDGEPVRDDPHWDRVDSTKDHPPSPKNFPPRVGQQRDQFVDDRYHRSALLRC
jgi:hypothetical protein